MPEEMPEQTAEQGPAELYAFLKGHGTRNDFVLLPDPDADVHGGLSAARVAALCDRRAGIGGDGVLRVVRTAAYAGLGSEVVPDADQVGAMIGEAEWFMDYRNADGSVSEMCGNGVRVFAAYLLLAGLAPAGEPVPVATRAGVKVITVEEDGRLTADMGTPTVLGSSAVSVGLATWTARHVDMGNPHAVAFVHDLDDPGPLTEPPVHDPVTYPHGVNVEFVLARGHRHVAMRVHERGSGETWSCGTGACAVMVATALADDAVPEGGTPKEDLTYRVDVPGGALDVTWTTDDRILLTGPAEVVATGETGL